MPTKTLLSWSSGKDSAWTLHVLREDPDFQVLGLVTTINAEFQRVAMHAVRLKLLEAQAAAAGLLLHVVPIPHPCSNEEYERIMNAFVADAATDGIGAMAFGDLFLEDVRDYRIRLLDGSGIAPVFPIWHRPTAVLAREMVATGLQARVTCLDPRALDRTFASRLFDDSFLDDLPDGIDPCGENGEFHTFAFAGPIFDEPLAISVGETVERDGFVFTDLVPA